MKSASLLSSIALPLTLEPTVLNKRTAWNSKSSSISVLSTTAAPPTIVHKMKEMVFGCFECRDASAAVLQMGKSLCSCLQLTSLPVRTYYRPSISEVSTPHTFNGTYRSEPSDSRPTPPGLPLLGYWQRRIASRDPAVRRAFDNIFTTQRRRGVNARAAQHLTSRQPKCIVWLWAAKEHWTQ